MADTCYYHPDATAKFTCPDCGEDVCDRCRLDGGLQRCGNCAVNGPPAGGPRVREAVVPIAVEGEVMCQNHPHIPADMQCLNCLQAFCMACMPDGAMCAPCKADPRGRAAPQTDYAPGDIHQFGYDDPVSFAAYGDEPEYEDGFDPGGGGAAAPPRPRRPAGAPGAKKGQPGKKGAPVGKKGGQKAPGKQSPPMGLIAGGIVALLAVGGGAWFMRSGPPAVEVVLPTKVSIIEPKGTTLKGGQTIKLTVASPELLDHVEVKVDGKYWAKFKADDSFTTDLPTSMWPNGKHVMTVSASYKNGKTVSDKKTYTFQNVR